MTEPPEPRRPEEDGGASDPGELIGNSSMGTSGAEGLAGRASDDEVSEVLKRSEGRDPEDLDVELTDAEIDAWTSDPDISTGYEDLDKLVEWGREVRDTELPPKTEPGRIQEIHDLNKLIEGNSMSLSSSAQILIQIGNDRAAAGALQSASTGLTDVPLPDLRDRAINAITEAQLTLGTAVAAAVEAAGEGTQSADAVAGAGERLKQAVADAQLAALAAETRLTEAQQAIQQAAALAAATVEADLLFRQTCTDAGGAVM